MFPSCIPQNVKLPTCLIEDKFYGNLFLCAYFLAHLSSPPECVHTVLVRPDMKKHLLPSFPLLVLLRCSLAQFNFHICQDISYSCGYGLSVSVRYPFCNWIFFSFSHYESIFLLSLKLWIVLIRKISKIGI